MSQHRHVEKRKPNPNNRTITNKVTGETVTWVKYSHETDGEETVLIVDQLPGGGPPMHYHRAYDEHFKAISGPLGLTLDGKEFTLQPGEDKVVKIGSTHRFTNHTSEMIQLQVTVRPAHAGLEKGLTILFGLANDGLVDATGIPTSIVDSAIFSCTEMTDTAFVGVQGWIMNHLVSVLAWYGRWSGRQDRLLEKYWY